MSASSPSAQGEHLLSPSNSALLIIDFQPIQVGSVASRDKRSLVENVVTAAKAAKLYGVPVILSTVNVKTGANKPLIPQLAEVFPEITPIDRTTLNAWEDNAFRSAVEATGRRKLVIAGLWTEVCVAFPALSAMADGYETYPLVDAMGSPTLDGHAIAVQRMAQAGAQPIGWVALLCEWQRDWARTATAPDFAKLLFAVEGA
jgi:nicotinamidase-related amidase